MQIRTHFPVVALAAAALAACGDRSPTLIPDDSSFVATVRGSVQEEYHGTGHFHHSQRGPGGPFPGVFMIASSNPARGQRFILYREGTAPPHTGRYPLTTPIAGSRFGATYTREQGGAVEGFVATSGEVVITTSTAERIEGTFRFEGVRACAGTASQVRCTHPIDLSQPKVEVSGSFVAVPGRTQPWPAPT